MILLKSLIPPTIVFAFHLAMIYGFNLYVVWPSFDIPMHFFGGVSIGISTYIVFVDLLKKNILHSLPGWLYVFLATCVVTTVAVIWEFAEFTSDALFLTVMQNGIADTMLDLFLGLLGGSVVSLYLYTRIKKVAE